MTTRRWIASAIAEAAKPLPPLGKGRNAPSAPQRARA